MYRTHKRALMGVVRPWARTGTICNAENDDPGGGGGGTPPGDQTTLPGTDDPPKTFTQDQLNALLAKERKATEAKFGDYDKLKEAAGKVEELNKRLEELEEEKTLAGKSAEEKERARAKKERETLLADKEKAETEKAEVEARLAAAFEEHRNTRARHTLSLALSAAKVYAPAAADALDAMMRDSTLEFDKETGELTQVTLANDGVVYDDMNKAAAAYLASKPHFAAGAIGGTGTRPPNGTRAGDKAIADMTPDERLKASAQQRAARANR